MIMSAASSLTTNVPTTSASASSSSSVALRPIRVLLIGAGNVAQAVVQQLQIARDYHGRRYGVQFDIYAIFDSRGSCQSIDHTPTQPCPLTYQQMMAVFKCKNEEKKSFVQQLAAPTPGCKFIEHSDIHGLSIAIGRFHSLGHLAKPTRLDPETILIDASGAEGLGTVLTEALSSGWGLTMANKKPMAGSQALFDKLTAPEYIHQIRFESTVGAGTPFVAVTRRVVDSGDTVVKIQGTFSGTLGYVMTGLENGKSYSQVVGEAAKLGYTEPDPRDDLGGVDVARKALILARILGWKFEMSDIQIAPLFTSELASLSIPDFMANLHTQDAIYAQKVRQAKENGQVLRYVASIESNKIVVGLRAVAADTPLGRLQGTENLLELYTQVYGAKPLVVQGAGAGAQVTAAGIVADMIELAGTIKGPNATTCSQDERLSPSKIVPSSTGTSSSPGPSSAYPGVLVQFNLHSTTRDLYGSLEIRFSSSATSSSGSSIAASASAGPDQVFRIEDELIPWCQNLCFDAVTKLSRDKQTPVTVLYFSREGSVTLTYHAENDTVHLTSKKGDQSPPMIVPATPFFYSLVTSGSRFLDSLGGEVRSSMDVAVNVAYVRKNFEGKARKAIGLVTQGEEEEEVDEQY